MILARRIIRATGQALGPLMSGALVAAGITSTALLMSGCYTYIEQRPSQLKPGVLVAAQISDVGRVALTPQIGSEIRSLQGQLVRQTDSSVELSVSEVQFLSGLSSPWRGQEVMLRSQDMKSLTQRTYSKRRSVIAALAMAGLAAVAIAAAGFAGLFSGDAGPGKGTDPPPES